MTRELPGNRPILLKNDTCPYCGLMLDEGTATKEHVIARNFVPRGKLDGQWNLILRACRACNIRKSELEDDISAASMHPDAWGRFHNPDPMLLSAAARKAENCISRRTGKPIKESFEKIQIDVDFAPGVKMSFGCTAPPQLSSERVFELSRLQLMAFFYWLTYNAARKQGGWWLGEFVPIVEAPRSDWGNNLHRIFMDRVVDWHPRIIATGADGFFRIAIRRNPSAVCWSWALEWNHNLRIVGFFGEGETVEKLIQDFPAIHMATVVDNPNERITVREEKALEEKDDKLFWPKSGGA
jgi:hypothetical protein